MAVLMPLDLVRPKAMLVPERFPTTAVALVRVGLTAMVLLLFAFGLSAALAPRDASRIGVDPGDAGYASAPVGADTERLVNGDAPGWRPD